MQRLAVDGGLLAVATLQDGFFTIEYVADEEGGASHVALGDVDSIVFGVILIVPHPGGSQVDAVVLLIGVFVRRRKVDWGILIPLTAYFERRVDLHFDDRGVVVAVVPFFH